MVDWPGTLPDLVSQPDYEEGFADVVIRSPMDTGRPKRRRRFTAAIKSLKVTIPLSGVELDIFTAFYEDDIKGGSLSFNYTHPRTGVAIVVAFVSVPQPARPFGVDRFSVTLDLEIIP